MLTISRNFLILSIALSFISPCSAQVPDKVDPYQKYNRHAYEFNKALDKWILKPVTEIYIHLIPTVVQQRVTHFFDNLEEIPTFINDVLQGKLTQANIAFWRFAINSTAGIAGFFDQTAYFDLPKHKNDFGLTLAKWGYKDSAFLVLPVLGPRTVRDSLSISVDQSYFYVYPYIFNVRLRNSLIGLSYVDNRAYLLNFANTINTLSFDPYIFERNAYLQKRKGAIKSSV